MMDKYLETGRIVAVQGLAGEVRVEPWCDSAEFLCGFDTLYFSKGEKPVEIEYSRKHKNIVIMKLRGVDSIEEAQLLRGKILYIDRDDVELEEGSYFVQDLIGLTVSGDDGRVYGKITDVFRTGANDVYTVKDGEKEYLVPAIPDVVLDTDIGAGTMTIHPLDGLFDGQEEV